MKLTAMTIPKGSAAFAGITLLGPDRKVFCHLKVVAARAGWDNEAALDALAGALVELVNDEGLIFGEAPDEVATTRIRLNLGKMLAWMPGYMRPGMGAYVNNGQAPGHFLTAILEGDAKQARMMADANNRRLIDGYFEKVRELLPPACHGSPEAVKAWIARKGLAGPAMGAATEGEKTNV